MKGKTKNPELRKSVIIELARANRQKSIPELSTITQIPFVTIDNILKEKDISILIDKSDKKTLISTKTGIREAYKYKLKSTPENLLAVFEYLETKQYQKKVMETDYYKSFIPYIEKKAKEDFGFTDSDYKQFESPEYKIYYDMGVKFSPSLVKLFLKIKSENSEIFKQMEKNPPHNTLYAVIFGLLFYDAIEDIIDNEEISKFQILGQS
jgi:hypothetical protein